MMEAKQFCFNSQEKWQLSNITRHLRENFPYFLLNMVVADSSMHFRFPYNIQMSDRMDNEHRLSGVQISPDHSTIDFDMLMMYSVLLILFTTKCK